MDANSIPRTYPSLVQQNFTWVDWMLTSKPKYFGLVPGTAYPTGVGLLVILLIMFICSMKWVRKGGYFEVKTNFYDCSINYRYLIKNVYFSDYKIVWIFVSRYSTGLIYSTSCTGSFLSFTVQHFGNGS